MDFQQAASMYQQLRGRLGARQISAQQFSAEVSQLQVQDGSGCWWGISESDGGWMRWNGAAWEAVAQPGSLPPTAIQATAQPASTFSPAAPLPQTASPASPGPQTLLQLLRLMIKSMILSLPKQIPIMIAVAVATWVIHTYLLVYVNEGFNPDHPVFKYVLALPGYNLMGSTLFWIVTGMLVPQAISGSLWKTLSGIGKAPNLISQTIQAGGGQTQLPLWIGAALALTLAALCVRSLVCIQLAIFALCGLAEQSGLLRMIVRLSWSDCQRIFRAGKNPMTLDGLKSNAVISGLSIGFIVAIIPCLYLGYYMWILVALAAGMAFYASTKNVPAARSFLVVLSTIGASMLARTVFADDGGWSESGGSFINWIKSEGAITAVIMGIIPSTGISIGVILGGTLGGLDDILSGAGIFPPDVPPQSVYGADYDKAMKDKQDALDELGTYKKQWEDSELSADKNDPNYENMKKQYQDYMDYLSAKANYADTNANAIAGAAETAKNTKILHGQDGRDYEIVYNPKTGTWKNTESGNDFDPDRFDQWQRDVARDKAFSDVELDKMSNRQDSFSKSMDQMVADQKAKKDAADQLNRIAKGALDHDMWNPGGPGDAYGKTQQLIKDIYDGKPIDQDAIDRLHTAVGDRITGKSADASILDQPENQDRFWDAVKDSGTKSIETIITGKDADGNISKAGLFGRLVAGIATGGASEIIYVGGNIIYSEKDAIDKGASDLGAAWAGVKTGIFEGGAILIGHALPGLGAKYFPNVTAGIGEMLQPVAKGIAAIDSAVQKGSKAIGNRIGLIFKPVPPNLEGTRAAVTRVLESGDPKDIAKLYSKDGMNKLAELQKAGHLSPAEAKALNSRLSAQVNKNIDNAMGDTINQFEGKNGVRVEKSILGDSGSSAKPGGNPKAKTDFDKTSVTNFNKQDLETYAKAKGCTIEEANTELQKKFSDTLSNNVDNHLRADGFSNGAKDVDYKTYTGIGKSAGQADAYPTGFTGGRQAVQGKGVQWEKGADGELVKHNVSGQAVVDQQGLNVKDLTGKLPDDPTKFHAGEFKDFSAQQLDSVNCHSDVKSIAKAMGRESDLSGRIQSMANSPNPEHANQLANAGLPKTPPKLNPELEGIAGQINKNPSQAADILSKNGYTEQTFVNAVKQNVNDFHVAIGGQIG